VFPTSKTIETWEQKLPGYQFPNLPKWREFSERITFLGANSSKVLDVKEGSFPGNPSPLRRMASSE
jgi:hypothetical protein